MANPATVKFARALAVVWLVSCLSPSCCFSQPDPLGENAKPSSFLKPFHQLSLGLPPLPPAEFNPDPPTSAFPPRIFPAEIRFQLSTTISHSTPQPPGRFNPDPTPLVEKATESFYQDEFGLELKSEPELIPEHLALPRASVRTRRIVEEIVTAPVDTYEKWALPKPLELPRTNVVIVKRLIPEIENPSYPLVEQGSGFPSNTVPVTNRWQVQFTPWKRYASGDTETPYQYLTPRRWHSYQQSVFKGDVPIYGQDIFLNLTAGSQTEFEIRRLPMRGGLNAARPAAAEIFGQSGQWSFQQSFSFSAELFKGETVFRPVDWSVRLEPVVSVKHVGMDESGVLISVPPGTPVASPYSKRTDTTRAHFAMQDASFEYHLRDISVNYDFVSIKAGIQNFNSDFRGFIFNDANLGVRLFGSAANNRYQYNAAIFDLLEKDTATDLNDFARRDQRVFAANLYRQDFLTEGYTAEWSFHANFDDGGFHRDRYGAVTRPLAFGAGREHSIHAYYLGWAGSGHIGPLNISHALYEVLGHDEFNGVAGRATDIHAQMATLELSLDRDWIRYKTSLLYASGDGNAKDGTAAGFDSIFDNAYFSGGQFSYYGRQGFGLLKPRNTLFPNLRPAKAEAQANFVNPGLILLGLGAEMELTPKWRTLLNLNYLRFADTDSLQSILLTDKIDDEIGFDFGLGFQYRPRLTDHFVITAGFASLIPGRGFRDLYERSIQPALRATQRGTADDFLFSGLLTVTFTY